MIPVELIEVSEASRFYTRRLIAALLVLLTSLLVVASLAGALGPDDRRGAPGILVDIAMLILLVGFSAFCALLVSFFFKVRTIRLTIAPGGRSIEFWRSGRYVKRMDHLVEQIRERQKLVEETEGSPAKGPAVYTSPPSLARKFLALLYFAVLPAVFVGQMRLLVLIALPVLWYVYRRGQFLRQPVEFRRAVRCFGREDWHGTIGHLTDLLHTYADYLPAYVLLVHVQMRAEQYDDALDTIAQYGEIWPEISRELYTTAWHGKRIWKRRATCPTPFEQEERAPSERDVCE
jgi:hypothetical protein